MRTLFIAAILALSLPLAPVVANAGPSDQLVESAMVKVVVQDGSTVVRHPGQECEHQAEYEIFMKQGKTKYVVTVLIDKADDDNKYQVKVTYKRNGKQVVSGDLTVAPKAAGSLSSGTQKISVTVDPAGTVDGRDKIEGPEGDNPLDGVKKKKK